MFIRIRHLGNPLLLVPQALPAPIELCLLIIIEEHR